MNRLLRIFGLVVALGLVSLSAIEAWPYYSYDYDNCYYFCTDGKDFYSYSTYTTYSDCCYRQDFNGWCPSGQTFAGVNGWGGTYTPLDACR
ncbi:MAG TPA: hypothetical protein VHN15_13695 [Thermoanaerobaculia bacterium]|nr:hypothetical protein [Thermoanaerobaculia bacterium]